MSSFKERTTAPSLTNKFYIKTTKGGYNKAMAIDKKTGSVLPNCCGAVHGRWLECTDCKEVSEDKLCLGNAGSYFKHKDDYERGLTPKIGAVICWSGGSAGHVGFVESVEKDGSLYVSSSSYGGARWTRKHIPKTFKYKDYKFQGFIYNPRVPDSDPAGLKVGDKVEIVDYGNSQASGKGRKAGGLSYIRYIIKVYADRVYPYRVGSKDGKSTTGYYKASALKKL